MRLGIAAIIVIALVLELYWLWNMADVSKPSESLSIPESNPIHRVLPEIEPTPGNGDRKAPALPKGSGEIRGTLRDAEGELASNFVLVLSALGEYKQSINIKHEHVWKAQSNGLGDFVFSSLPYGDYLLSAGGSGQHLLEQVKIMEGAPLLELRPKLRISHALRGRVVDSQGNDLPDLQVLALHAQGAKTMSEYSLLPAQSNARGEFQLEHLPEGAWRLLFVKEGFSNLLSEVLELPGADSINVAMNTGGTLSLHLIHPEEGGTVSGKIVELRETQYGLEYFHAPLDAEGKITFTQLRPATWRATLLDSPLIIPEGAPMLDLSGGAGFVVEKKVPLVIGGAINGRVLQGVRGVGMEETRVSARLDGEENVISTFTDSEGAYRFQGLQKGMYTLSVEMPEEYVREGGEEENVAVALGENASAPDFLFMKGVSVQGVIIGRDGKGVQNALVNMELLDKKEGELRSTRSTTGGHFTFDGLKSGDQFNLSSSWNGVLSPKLGPHKVGQAGLSGLKLQLSHPNRASIAGIVVNAQGRPVKDAVVSCKPPKSSGLSEMKATTDRSGYFQFNDLVPGEYRIMAGRSAEAMADKLAQIVELPPNGIIEDMQLLLP